MPAPKSFPSQKKGSKNQKDSTNKTKCFVCLPDGIRTIMTEINLQSFYLALITLIQITIFHIFIGKLEIAQGFLATHVCA